MRAWEPNVVRGIHRVDDGVNWYLVEEAGRLAIVDAGIRRSWDSLVEALDRMDADVRDVEALVLTHAHLHHLGFAERLRRTGVDVWIHAAEAQRARHPMHCAPGGTLRAHLRHPRSSLGSAWRGMAGGLTPLGVQVARTFVHGDELPVPGRPRVVHTPGHSPGHCALVLPDHDAVVSGDALVTRDPFSGRAGPRIVAAEGGEDAVAARVSAARLGALDVHAVLPGHGEPWHGGVRAALAAAGAAPAAIPVAA